MKTEKSKKKNYSINNNKYDIDFNKIPKPLKWGIYIMFCLYFGYMIGSDMV